MDHAKESPSAANAGAESNSATTFKLALSLPDADVLARARRHDHGLLVTAERADGVVTQQIYTNLPAASRKVAKVRARGLAAALTLVRLVPVVGSVEVGGDAL